MESSSIFSTLRIKGMDCADCATKIEEGVNRLDGVQTATVHLLNASLRVQYDGARLDERQIADRVRQLGYGTEPDDEGAERTTFWRQHGRLVLTALSGVFTGAGIVHSVLHAPDTMTLLLYAAAVATGGYYVARKAWGAVRNLSLDMNVLMLTAVLGAALIGEWSEGAMVIFLFSVANLLESYSMDRVRNAIRSLMDLAPKMALVRRSDGEVLLPVEEVKIGEVLIVRPGEKIPLDGMVIAGSSSVNQAPITGESMPVSKAEEDEVYGGTLNQQGALEVEVTHLSEDTTLARIIHMVEEAQSERAPSQSFVDRFARVYTPAVVLGAILVALLPPLVFGADWGTWFYRALVLLVISCPCALVISTPVTVVSGLARAARSGILIKGGIHLEHAGRVKAIAFDKTGTLTQGSPEVVDVVPVGRLPESEILRKAASIERRSEHALAAAILRRAEQDGLGVEETMDFQAIIGKGARARLNGETYLIGSHRLFEEEELCTPEMDEEASRLEAQGKTVVYFGTEQEPLGLIAVADTVRGGVKEVLAQLRQEGVKHLGMLTGDNRGTAEAIARELGLDEFRAELLPQDKVTVVREWQDKYGTVAMVGDGVNDAPALARATVGIAMGTVGTDTALETADIALMADDLSRLPETIRLSRKALRIVQENIVLAIGIKVLFLGLAMGGLASLWMAVLADTGVSLMVIFNGLRASRSNV